MHYVEAIDHRRRPAAHRCDAFEMAHAFSLQENLCLDAGRRADEVEIATAAKRNSPSSLSDLHLTGVI